MSTIAVYVMLNKSYSVETQAVVRQPARVLERTNTCICTFASSSSSETTGQELFLKSTPPSFHHHLFHNSAELTSLIGPATTSHGLQSEKMAPYGRKLTVGHTFMQTDRSKSLRKSVNRLREREETRLMRNYYTSVIRRIA